MEDNKTNPESITGGVVKTNGGIIAIVDEKKDKEPVESHYTDTTRNPDGTFKPGFSGNPAGKIPGTICLAATLKRKLKEVPLGQIKEYGEQVIETLLELAIVKGDSKAIKIIMNYADGLPRQTIGLDGGEGGEPIKISVETQGQINEALSKFIGVTPKK